MEDKAVILSLLIMSLVMAQIQVEAKICCPSNDARNFYDLCRRGPLNRQRCASKSGCQISNACPPGWENDIVENSGDTINEYCKLGCATSVCGAMINLQNSDASEIVNGAVEQCGKACSTFCTKGSKIALETA